MNEIKLFESELRLMEIVWENNPIAAKELSLLASERMGWNKNTTYTVIKRLINKKILLRSEPNYLCEAIISKEQVQSTETKNLVDRLYDGSSKTFFASFIKNENLTSEDIEELKKIINEKE